MKTPALLSALCLPIWAAAQSPGLPQNLSPQVDSLIQVSRNLTDKREFSKALEISAAAEKIALDNWGRESAAYGSACFNHGRVCFFKRDYPEAEKWYLEAKPIREKTLGKEHPDYAQLLNNFGTLYWNMGDFEKAEPYHIQALAIRKKVLGREHLDCAWSLQNLANVYRSMGDFEKAEPLFWEALSIREKILGKQHPDIGGSLNDLAILYWDMGNFEKSEPLYLQSLALQEKATGKEHPDYAASLDNLASLYYHQQRHEQAEKLYLEAMSIREKTLGKQHPEYATSLNNLAGSYNMSGQYEKAESLYLEALSIREKALGQKHPLYLRTLNNLAAVYRNKGEYTKSESLHRQALAIIEEVLGKEHADYSTTLYNLSNVLERQNRFADSEPLLKEALGRTQSRIQKSTSFLAEKELANYVATFQHDGNRLFAFLLSRRAKNETFGTLPALCYDHALFQKGFLLTAASRLNTQANASPATEKLNAHFKTCRRRLATEYAKPLAERGDVPALEAEAEAAEKELARSVAGYAEAVRQVKWQAVQAVLKKDEAAVEFVRFKVNFPKKTDSLLYAALLLKNDSNPPFFIPLFEEKQLDSLLKSSGGRKADYVNGLYSLADRGVVVVGRPQKSLYELL